MQLQISRDDAWTLLCEWTNSDSLRRHMLAVEAAMRAYAPRFDGDVERARVFAEAVPPMYRRRKVPMDDLINLSESIRTAVGAILPLADMSPVDATVDVMIERFRWNRRIAGDARKRNRLLQAIYKGA